MLNTVRQYTITDIIALGGGEPGNEMHVFLKKTPAGNTDLKCPSRSDFYTFILVTEGSLQVSLSLINYTIPKNTMLFIFPGITFQFTAFSKDLVFNGIVFTPDFLTGTGFNEKYIDALGFLSANQSPQLLIKQNEANILHNSLQMLHTRNRITKDYPFRSEIIHHLFNSLLFELAAIYKNNYTGNELILTRKEDTTFRFLKLLPQYFKKERSVHFYAENLFITPKYLSQTVKEVTGKTAGYFIDEMLMLEAKVLLNNISLSIAQVADELHFSDQFSFSKFFKRVAAITPSDYRRQIA